MNVALQPGWTQERFLHWVEGQDEPYEFDGVRPVPMTRGDTNHNRLMRNILNGLDRRLGKMVAEAFGPEVGIATIGRSVRYPDVLVGLAPNAGHARLIREPVIVFEIPSRHSQRADRVVKVREYAAVPSIRRYVIVETELQALTVLAHEAADAPWTSAPLGEGDALALPELGIEMPLSEIYESVSFEVVQED